MWKEIKGLKGKTLFTVKGSPFDIIEVNDNTCKILVNSSKKVRTIPRQEFERAIQLGSPTSLTPSLLRQKGASEANPAYVLAILLSIKNVPVQ